MRLNTVFLLVSLTLASGLDVAEVISRAERSLEDKARSRMEEGAVSTTRRKITKRFDINTHLHLSSYTKYYTRVSSRMNLFIVVIFFVNQSLV